MGFSSWIIIYSFGITPHYSSSPLSKFFDFSYDYTYDGYEKYPTIKEGADTTGITFSYEYLDLNDPDAVLTSGCPTDASNYEIIITATGNMEGTCKVRLNISPKKIKTKLIEISYSEALSYNSTDCRYWNDFADELLNDKIIFTDENGSTLASNLKPLYQIKSMSTGDANCEYVDNNDIVIGSTYLVKIALMSTSIKNYDLYDYETYYSSGKNTYADTGSAVLKYKTVLYNSQYYTIEDVITKSGDLVVVGDSTKTIFTSFTNFNYYTKFTDNKLTYSLNSGTNLWITYDGTKTLKDTSTTQSQVYSCLFIPNNVVLNVNGTINVCGAYKKMTHEVVQRGVLFNNGTINLNGTLYSYGFTKGSGMINANSSSKVYDFMRFYNYANSGGITMSLNNAKIFPLSVYSMHNISCKIKIAYNSIYYVSYDVEISSVDITGDLVIVGDGGLFELSDGYLIKSVEDTTGNFFEKNADLKDHYNKSNQDVTQRDVLEIYGSFFDNVVKIKESGQGIETGKDYAMPIGFMKISLKNDGKGNVGNGTLQSNSYKFLPGSVLTIDEEVTLTIASGVNVIFYDQTYEQNLTGAHGATVSYYNKHTAWYNQTKFPVDSQFIVNGNLISYGNLGGYIQTESLTGFIQLSSKSAQLKRLTGEDYGGTADQFSILLGGTTATTVTDTINATGFIDTTDNATFNPTVYISQYGDYYYWTSATSAEKFIINFYDEDNTLLSSKTVYVLEPINGKYIYEISGLEFLPSKNYYCFGNWYLSNGEILSDENNKLIYEVPDTPVTHDPTSIDLYANWIPFQYSFDFIGMYIDPLTSENILLSESDGFKLKNFVNVTFTYDDILNSNISIPFTAEYLNCDFNGWYITANSETILINNQLSLDNFLKFSTLDLNENIDDKTGTITLLCRFTDYQEYTIKFDDALPEYENQESLVELNPYLTFDLPNITDFNHINENQKYIKYWSYSPRIEDNAVVSAGMTPNDIINLINKYNNNASETEKIDIINNTIVLYAITDMKEFTISYYNGNVLSKTHYFNSGYPVKISDGLDKNGSQITKDDSSNGNIYYTSYEFDGWTLENNSSDVLALNDVIFPTESVRLNSHFLEKNYCVIKISNIGNDKIKIKITYYYNGISDTSSEYTSSNFSQCNIKFDYNSNVKIDVTYPRYSTGGGNESSKTFTCTGASGNNTYAGLTGNLQSSTSTSSLTYNSVIENLSLSATCDVGCLVEGTLILLADGSYKKIEDITETDQLLTFNHYTGSFEVDYIDKLYHNNIESKEQVIINLVFDDGTILRIVDVHTIFNATLNKYVSINLQNINEYINHDFIAINNNMNHFDFKTITLKRYYTSIEKVKIYSPVTINNLNLVANDILTVAPLPYGLENFMNIFEFDSHLKYDYALLEKDISIYGLYEYERFKDYITEEEFNLSPLKYFKIAVGKGIFNEADIFNILKLMNELKRLDCE